MIQRALIGELEPKDDRALQKIGRKKQAKNAALLMEVPELNTALIEAYRDLDRTTRAAKDLARRIKMAQQQAKSGYRAIASHRAKTGDLRAKLAIAATLEPPCPNYRGPTSPFPKPELECYDFPTTAT